MADDISYPLDDDIKTLSPAQFPSSGCHLQDDVNDCGHQEQEPLSPSNEEENGDTETGESATTSPSLRPREHPVQALDGGQESLTCSSSDRDDGVAGALDALEIPSVSFDSEGGDSSCPDGPTPMKRPSILGTATRTQIDTSETPRAAVMEGTEDLDFEILPDDEDEDDEGDDDDDHDDDAQHDDECLPSKSFEEATKEEEDSHRQNEHHRHQPDRAGRTDGGSPSISPPTSFHGLANKSSSNYNGTKDPGSPVSRRRLSFLQKNPLSPRPSLRGQQSAGGGSALVSQAVNSATTGVGTTTGNLTVGPLSSDAAVSGGQYYETEKPKRGNRFIPKFRTMGGAFKDGGADMLAAASAGAGAGTEEQESSSDDSSYDDDEQWLEGESQIFDDDIDQVIDFGTLSSLPNSFLNLPPHIYDHLDSDLVKNIQNQNISTFAWEHHLFVKGLLEILAERDLIGVEDDVFDTSNVSKMGVLRKKHAKSGWHVKYVEVRKGNLTFFADRENEQRRTVHLRKRTCSCRASAKEWGDDLVFELIVDGGKRMLWMAKSEEECEGWIKAINQAMIGDTVDTRNVPLDMKMYKTAIDAYQSVRSSLKEVGTRQEYLLAVNTLLYRQTSSSALRVPMKWIRETVIVEHAKFGEELDPSPNGNDRVKAAVREFWDDLCSTSTVLNGYLVEAKSTYSGERIIGALCRCILEFDKVENDEDFQSMFSSLKRSHPEETNSFISEVQAVSYARSILSGAIRSKNRGDAQAVLEELFRNDDVVQIKMESSEPLHIDISFAGDDFSEDKPRPTESAGWIETKYRKNKNWKKWYFVATEGVLSYFECADPRPYGLRGQVVLRNARIKTLEGNSLVIETLGKERELRFEDRGELIKWKGILMGKAEDGQIDSESTSMAPPAIASQAETTTSPSESRRTRHSDEIVNGKPLKVVREAGATLLRNAADGMGGGFKAINRAKAHANRAAVEGIKLARNATGAGMRSVRERAGMFIRGVRGGSDMISFGTTRRRPTSDMLISSTRALATKKEKREPTVQAIVEVNYLFKIMTKAEEGKTDEVLLIVRVKLYQAFLLSGGPYGRLASGDELLLMEFSKGDTVEDVQNEFLELPTSL